MSGREPAGAVGQQGQWSGRRAGHRVGKSEDKLDSVGTSALEFHYI